MLELIYKLWQCISSRGLYLIKGALQAGTAWGSLRKGTGYETISVKLRKQFATGFRSQENQAMDKFDGVFIHPFSDLFRTAEKGPY